MLVPNDFMGEGRQNIYEEESVAAAQMAPQRYQDSDLRCRFVGLEDSLLHFVSHHPESLNFNKMFVNVFLFLFFFF